ncbi:MAG: tRNA preQ1(34) S-adenosylmethionine ribosyltransferase-isomerase QueA [Paracoccaceae bacterium]
MDLSDFDFSLPEHLIALRPARPRPTARLLVVTPGRLEDDRIDGLVQRLRPGDRLVLNDTRVIPARLIGERRRETRSGSGTARIEATLIRRDGPETWGALARPGKRLAPGDIIRFGPEDAPLSATVTRRTGAEVTLAFPIGGAELDTRIAEIGLMPLPPYIAQRRPPDAQDREDYQTVFAAQDGAVAAPTAALHFDDALLDRLSEAGIGLTRLTLHVGTGTFLPVSAETLAGQELHAERGQIAAAAADEINGTRAAGGRIIAVGTTSLRLLETAADETGRIAPFAGETRLFIKPGHRFRAVDGLMTNFHLPRSTLFVLVAAFMGLERMRAAYAHAVAKGYRFYSYGDSSLLLPDG